MWKCPDCKTINELENNVCSKCRLDLNYIEDLEGVLFDVPLKERNK